MRNIAHRTPPRYSNTIQGRADYDDCAYEGEPEADIIARRQYLNKLLDAPPKVRSYLLGAIDRRGRIPPIAELVEFANVSLVQLVAYDPLTQELILRQNLSPIWRHGDRNYSMNGKDVFLVPYTDDIVLSLFVDSPILRSRKAIEDACDFENAPR